MPLSESSPKSNPNSRPFSPQFLRLLSQGLVIVAIFHACFQLFYWLPGQMSQNSRDLDLTVYYDAAMRLKNGQPLYQPWPGYTPHLLPSRFFYPPPFLLLSRPLVELGYTGFLRVWYSVLLLAFWIYAACLAKMATGKLGWRAVLIAGMCIDLCPRGYVAMGFGNFEPVMWACYGLAFATSFRGVPLAFAMMMKLHPLWTLALVLKDEGWRGFRAPLTVLAVGIAGGIWLCGLQNSALWWPSTSNVVSQGTFFDGNVSLSFAVLRLIRWLGADFGNGPLPKIARIYLSLMALAAPLAAIYLSRKQPKDLRYALTASATILFAPLCWNMYIPLLLSPAAIIYQMKNAK